MNRVIKTGLVSLLAAGSVLGCSAGETPVSGPSASSIATPAADGAQDHSGANHTKAGSVTRLMTQILPDLPEKEGMIEIVEFAPGEASQVHRHNCDLFVYVLEGSVETH